MPTFCITRTSNHRNGGPDKTKLVKPIPEAYMKEEITPSGNPWYYFAIDMEWTDIPDFMKKVDEDVVITKSPIGDEEFGIEIYDDYRE